MISPLLVVTISALLWTSAAAQKVVPLRIYVGPEMRDGFVDADRGVQDSIKDIHNGLRRNKTFSLVTTPENAEISVLVIRRGISGSAGAVAVPLGTGALAVPIDRVTVEAVLRVGDHSKPLIGVSDNWRSCANQIVKDIGAWVKVNREHLPK